MQRAQNYAKRVNKVRVRKARLMHVRKNNLMSGLIENLKAFGDQLDILILIIFSFQVDSEKKYGIKGSSRYFPREQQMVPNQFKVKIINKK